MVGMAAVVYGASRFDTRDPFQSSYSTPGWQRAQRASAGGGGFGPKGQRRSGSGGPRTIEGDLVVKSVADEPSGFSLGERVFHLKFGYGAIVAIEGNKLTVQFEKAGRKKVLDGFVERH